MSRRLIFTRYSTVPIAHIAPAVVAVFVEAIGYQSSVVASAIDENLEDAIDAEKLTAADVVAVVSKAEFADFDRLVSPPVTAGNLKSKIWHRGDRGLG